MRLGTKIKSVFIGIGLTATLLFGVHELDSITSGTLDGPGGQTRPDVRPRTHQVPVKLKQRQNARITLTVHWTDMKPWIIWFTRNGIGPALHQGQIPDSPQKVTQTYVYDRLDSYDAEASQHDPRDNGATACDIDVDGTVVDSDTVPYGAGTAHCWVIAG